MPFLLGAIPAIVGAAGGIGGALIGRGGANRQANLQQEEIDAAKQTQTEKMNLINENEPTLNQYSGPADQSPFYKSLYAKGVEATNQAYQNARESTANTAKMAGFGYESPNVAGAGAELKAAEASSLARVPGEAYTQAIQPGLEAAQIRANESGSLSPNYTAANQITGQIAGQQETLGRGIGAAAGQLAGSIPTGGSKSEPNPYIDFNMTSGPGYMTDPNNPENYVNEQQYGGALFNPSWG